MEGCNVWLVQKRQEKKHHNYVVLPTDEYDFEIVGESYYQKTLKAVAGAKEVKSKRLEVTFQVVLEDNNPHDANAVRVQVADGHPVGHFSRQDALDLRQALAEQGVKPDSMLARGIIVGGWKNKNDEGHYGVKLSIDPGFEVIEAE